MRRFRRYETVPYQIADIKNPEFCDSGFLVFGGRRDFTFGVSSYSEVRNPSPIHAQLEPHLQTVDQLTVCLVPALQRLTKPISSCSPGH